MYRREVVEERQTVGEEMEEEGKGKSGKWRGGKGKNNKEKSNG